MDTAVVALLDKTGMRLETLPDQIFSFDLLHPGCYFILEHGDEHSFTDHPRFKKERHYGRVHFSFFE